MTQTKRCPHCGREKPVRYFTRDRTRRDGYYPRCKQCRRPQVNAAAARNRKRYPEKCRAYAAETREYKRVVDRARYHADIETSRAIQREKAARFRQRHRDELNARKREERALRKAILSGAP